MGPGWLAKWSGRGQSNDYNHVYLCVSVCMCARARVCTLYVLEAEGHTTLGGEGLYGRGRGEIRKM